MRTIRSICNWAAATYIRGTGNVTLSALRGSYFGHDVRVVGIAGTWNTTSAPNQDVQIHRNGSSLATIDMSSVNVYEDLTLNLALASGGRLALYLSAASVISSNHSYTVYVRRDGGVIVS